MQAAAKRTAGTGEGRGPGVAISVSAGRAGPRLPLFAVALFVLCLPAPAKGGKNLVPNSGFEKGSDGPANWTGLDNLTLFWERGGPSGKFIRMDTNVYREEWQRNKDNPGSVRKKTPTSGTLYNTVGGTVGVTIYSYPIPVESDACYLVEYDFKGPGPGCFVYLKGYWKITPETSSAYGKDIIFFKPDPEGTWFSLMVMGGVGVERHQPQPGDYVQKFRRRFNPDFKVAGDVAGKWCHYKGVVHLKKRHHVEAVLLQFYAYWPAGEYCVDNIEMRKISKEEHDRFSAGIKDRSIPHITLLE